MTVADTGFVVALLNQIGVMAIAERYSSKIVLTLDQRDFRLFRPRHCDAFELFP
jgi:hypothetical protein